MRKKIYYIFLAIITAVLCLTLVNHIQADYQSTVLADNPLLYFRFEDAGTGGDVDDDGSVGRGGTYIGDSITGIPSAPGLGIAAHLGQENIFDGGGDCVSVDDSDFVFGLPDVTYEAWIKIAPGDLAYSRIFQHNGSWLEEGAPGVMMNTYEYGVIGGDKTNYGLEAPTDDGEWHHVVITYDSGASTLKELYVDGVSVGTASAPNDLSYDHELITIGAEGNQWWMYNHLKGAIDEFAIYEGILSECKIKVHYNALILDPDLDGDLVTDDIDNCPCVYNPDQTDSDGDDIGDECDNCPGVYNPGQADSDGDNIGDYCECETANLNSIDPINFEDFAILGEGWSTTGPGDTNRDDIVDFIDLLQVVEHWLEECGQP